MLKDPIAVVRSIEASNFHQAWKSTSQHSAMQIAEYILARAVEHAERDQSVRDPDEEAMIPWAVRRLMSSFTPVTNKIKLANGRHSYDTLEAILYTIGMKSYPTQEYDEVLAGKMRTLARAAHQEVRLARVSKK